MMTPDHNDVFTVWLGVYIYQIPLIIMMMSILCSSV